MESGCSAEFLLGAASTLIVYGGGSRSGTWLPNLGHYASGLRNALSSRTNSQSTATRRDRLYSRLELLEALEHREGGFWIGMR